MDTPSSIFKGRIKCLTYFNLPKGLSPTLIRRTREIIFHLHFLSQHPALSLICKSVVLVPDYIHWKRKKKNLLFLLLPPFFAHLITAPTCHGQTHTHTHADAQMSTAGGTFFKISEEDKEWWKALRSNKRKVALVEWELFGPVKEKVMKHSSRSNVKLNQRICGRPKRQTQNIKNGGLWHGQPTGPQRDYKYSHITWLISMKRLAVSSPTNRLWQVCRGVCVSCRQWDMLRWLWCSDTATPHGPTELPSGAHVGTTASSIHSWSARQHSQ